MCVPVLGPSPLFYHCQNIEQISEVSYHFHILLFSVLRAQSDAHLTGDQEVAGSVPARSGNILLWRLIMK